MLYKNIRWAPASPRNPTCAGTKIDANPKLTQSTRHKIDQHNNVQHKSKALRRLQNPPFLYRTILLQWSRYACVVRPIAIVVDEIKANLKRLLLLAITRVKWLYCGAIIFGGKYGLRDLFWRRIAENPTINTFQRITEPGRWWRDIAFQLQ